MWHMVIQNKQVAFSLCSLKQVKQEFIDNILVIQWEVLFVFQSWYKVPTKCLTQNLSYTDSLYKKPGVVHLASQSSLSKKNFSDSYILNNQFEDQMLVSKP